MNVNPPRPAGARNAERSEATRAALVAAARRLFGERGYAGVGTEEVVRAAGHAVEWSGHDPLVFGGDLNLRPRAQPEPFALLKERFGLGEPTAPDVVDHVLMRGLQIAEPSRRLAPERRELVEPDGRRLRLSDHRLVAARFVR
jgi:hypothetical protein